MAAKKAVGFATEFNGSPATDKNIQSLATTIETPQNGKFISLKPLPMKDQASEVNESYRQAVDIK